MNIICINPSLIDFAVLLFWIISIPLIWIVKKYISQDFETQYRVFLSYVILSTIFILITFGKLIIPEAYLVNITTEVIGIGITVFLIDWIYRYINNTNEQLYRKLALKNCKMPIYSYCAYWLMIFEQDDNKCRESMNKYQSLEEFFSSDEFRIKITSFDFNKNIGENITYAKFFDDRMNELKDRFQSILVKYASKLSHKDIKLLENFGGKSYMYTVFSLNKFMSDVKFTHKHGDEPEEVVIPFNNCFKDITKENFPKHFMKLVELINEYNSSVDNEFEKWTIKNINILQSIESANLNPATEW